MRTYDTINKCLRTIYSFGGEFISKKCSCVEAQAYVTKHIDIACIIVFVYMRIKVMPVLQILNVCHFCCVFFFSFCFILLK